MDNGITTSVEIEGRTVGVFLLERAMGGNPARWCMMLDVDAESQQILKLRPNGYCGFRWYTWQSEESALKAIPKIINRLATDAEFKAFQDRWRL